MQDTSRIGSQGRRRAAIVSHHAVPTHRVMQLPWVRLPGGACLEAECLTDVQLVLLSREIQPQWSTRH